MKRAVYDFIAENPNSTIHKCAEALKIDDLAAMVWIHALTAEGVVKTIVLPLGNEIDSNCSLFYSVCGQYGENSNERYPDSETPGKQASMSLPDVLGNNVSAGDTVMLIAQDGRYLTTEVVKSCGENRCYFKNHETFAYQDSYRTNDAIFSVTALKERACNLALAGESKRDALGNVLSIGDVVLLIETGYRRFQKGTVMSMAGKSCVVTFPNDCYGRTEGRRFYRDIVSLTKLGLEDINM